MATGVNVKMGVSGLSDFKRSMSDAEASVKTLTAALKLNESQLQLNGNEELALKNRVELLKEQIKAQAEVVRQAENALKAMKDNGVSEASRQFQDMQGKVYTAATKLMDMKANLQEVENGAKGAAGQTENLNTNVEKISKSEAWQNFADGVGKVTSKLEQGARAAINFGKRILGSFKDSAEWADDLKTLSDETGYSVDQLQRMDKVAHRVEADAETIAWAMNRMKKAATTEGGVKSIEEMLGLSLNGKSADDLFWEVGEALLNLGDEFDKEAAATKIFGRSWHELIPLFKTGRDAYEKMLEEQNVLTDEQVDKLAKGDDAIREMENEIQQLKNQFWSENADNIKSLLQWLIDNKDSVVTALGVIGTAFAGLKIVEIAAGFGQMLDGFKKLGLLGGAGGASAAAGAATGATTISGGASMAGMLAGFGGLSAIIAGFGWAADRGVNHRDEVRGTEEYLAAQSAGTEALLAEYIRAQQAASMLDWSATVEEVDAAYARISELYERLNATEGGRNSLSAYSDWRQERSLGNMDWEMPENIDKMTRTVQESFSSQAQSNSEMTAAANDLKGLPVAISAAVRNGMSGVSIVIGADAVAAISRQVRRDIGRGVHALLD